MTKFYSLLYDSTFKYFLKESPHLKFFSDLIEKETGYSLMDYEFHDQELNTGNHKKDFRLDILLKKEDHLIIIELNSSYNTYTKRKNYAYLYRIASAIYEKGEDYEKKRQVTLINMNNWTCEEKKEESVDYYNFHSTKYQRVIGGIESFGIYLGKYKGKVYNGSNKVEASFALFTAQSYKEARAIVGDWKEGGEIVDELEKLRYNDEFNAVYDAEIVQKKLENSARKEGYTEGESIGMKKGEIAGKKAGIKQEKHSIASSMLKKNFDIKTIMDLVGLSKEEILSLR